MPTKFDPRQKERLLSADREARLHPKELLRTLGLKAGDSLADIGCGPGFFTIPAAELVGPDGQIVAADIQGEMLTTVRVRAAEQGLHNVRLVKASESDVPLRPGQFDVVLSAFVLHEVPRHATFLRKMALLLKPKGRLAVMEWQKRATEFGPPLEDRITPDELIADAQAAGLRMSKRQDLGDEQYLCVFVAIEKESGAASK
ncbi:MAG TPA: methyltransferase domain-containing protein [Ktedonobacterales bacterium]